MAEARSLLGAGGPVADALGGGYEPREEQLRMADAVERAMRDRGHLLVEAGTGVGKSFAYLAPAVVRAALFGERVVVSTHTIALQEQLMGRDIPLLLGALKETLARSPGPVREVHPSLVKGRGNYLSIRRLELASKRQASLLPDAPSRQSLHTIEDWAYATADGTLSTLPQLDRPAVWDRVQSDSGNCMGRKCPRFERCFYQNARRDMERASLLVTNHALFFSDLSMRARGVGFLPPYDHVVLDEAHTAEEVAADHFGASLSEGRVGHLLGVLHHARTGKGFLAQLAEAVDDDRALHAAIGAVRDAEAASLELFGSLAVIARGGRSDNAEATVRLREPEAVGNTLTPAFGELAARLRLLREGLPDTPALEADRFELNAYIQRAAEVASVADQLLSQSLEGCVYWVQATRTSTGRERVTLAAAPVDVGPMLARTLFAGEKSVTLTSATLATRAARGGHEGRGERAERGFAHAIDRLGANGATTLALGSPFDFARQVRVLVDERVGSPARGGDDGYERRLADAIVEHVGASRGGAFVLFTSHRLLGAMANATRPRLAEQGVAVHAQGLDGSRAAVLERFREDPQSALFGAASFWQGVDVPGRGLRRVVITRLPFDPPDRPLTEARAERLRKAGRDPFREDALPRAVIRFKQGFGRLIRNTTDSGEVVVLDPRLLTAGYGASFRAAIPHGVAVERHRP